MPTYLESRPRGQTWYAILGIPEDVRHHFEGRLRFCQSTRTGHRPEALLIASVLASGWKADIAKARRSLLPRASMGKRGDANGDLWEQLRRQFIRAASEDPESADLLAIQEVAERESRKIADRDRAAYLYKLATDQLSSAEVQAHLELSSLMEEWKHSLKALAPKTVDQMHRDGLKMAAHFGDLGSLDAQAVKSWTDKLVREGATGATIERLGKSCRSFWKYLQRAGVRTVMHPDPFAGPFKLAQAIAPRTKTKRSDTHFEPQEAAALYAAALAKGDQPLADLIALGAYTGARIEELCSLTKETARDGILRMGTKTEASEREVPVHPAIRPLVTRLKHESVDGYLIFSTAAGKYGVRSDPLSKRFGHLKTAGGFGRGHVFHSLRKTVATLLEQAGVSEGVAADLLGHDKKTMSYGLYSAGSSLLQKRAAINKIAYPGDLMLIKHGEPNVP